MWLWECELRSLGFRRKSERYWQCERGHELPVAAHLSVFTWSEQRIPPRADGGVRWLVELTEFHVTFQLGLEHVHFYYHEQGENDRRPAGHTSSAEIARLRESPRACRREADVIAAALVSALGGVLLPRRKS
jgi:hypothetical protein